MQQESFKFLSLFLFSCSFNVSCFNTCTKKNDKKVKRLKRLKRMLVLQRNKWLNSVLLQGKQQQSITGFVFDLIGWYNW